MAAAAMGKEGNYAGRLSPQHVPTNERPRAPDTTQQSRRQLFGSSGRGQPFAGPLPLRPRPLLRAGGWGCTDHSHQSPRAGEGPRDSRWVPRRGGPGLGRQSGGRPSASPEPSPSPQGRRSGYPTGARRLRPGVGWKALCWSWGSQWPTSEPPFPSCGHTTGTKRLSDRWGNHRGGSRSQGDSRARGQAWNSHN